MLLPPLGKIILVKRPHMAAARDNGIRRASNPPVPTPAASRAISSIAARNVIYLPDRELASRYANQRSDREAASVRRPHFCRSGVADGSVEQTNQRSGEHRSDQGGRSTRPCVSDPGRL